MPEFTLDQLGRMLLKIQEDLEELKVKNKKTKLTTKEVAKMVGKSPHTIRYWIKHKEFPVIKPDGDKSNLLFEPDKVEQWLKQNRI